MLPKTQRVSLHWIGEAFRLFSRRPGVWILATIAYLLCLSVIVLLVNMGIAIIEVVIASRGGKPDQYVFLFIEAWCCMAYNGYLLAGFQRMGNAAVRGEAISVRMLFSGRGLWGEMMYAAFWVALLSIASAFALGIGAVIAYSLVAPAIAITADGVLAGDAMKISFKAMKAQWHKALIVYMALLIIGILLCLPCGIGIFVWLPIRCICFALAYRDVIGMPATAPADSTL